MMFDELQIWKEISQRGCFTVSELKKISGDCSAETVVKILLDKNMIAKVHDDLYVAIDKSTGLPAEDNRFVIATRLSADSYLTHHSAFEYYGCYNQVYGWVYTSGGKAYSPFVYDNLEYHYIPTDIACGIAEHPDRVRVTDIERTVLDAVNDFDEIDGLEEVLKCIELVSHLDEQKMIKYLELYGSAFLYQKTGYILEHYKEMLKLSNSFIDECQKHIAEKTEYFSCTDVKHLCNTHSKKWNMIVPENLYSIAGKGTGTYYDL